MRGVGDDIQPPADMDVGQPKPAAPGLTTRERFDIITSDPIHPWVKGAATLYTREYFEMCRRHLNPGGLVTQWVPLYQSNFDTVKSEMATFFDVFPHGTIWANDLDPGGYDLVLLGGQEPPRIDVDALQRRLEEPGYATVAQSLREAGFVSAVALLSTYAGRASGLGRLLAGTQINRDCNLRLQYLAGMGLNLHQEDLIYPEIVRLRRYPDDMFTASPERAEALRKALR